MMAPPPRWSPHTYYPLSAVVWHEGCYWRCGEGHQSEPNESPSLSPLWSMISTTQPPSSESMNPPPYSHSDHQPSASTSTSASTQRADIVAPIANAVRNFASMFDRHTTISPVPEEKGSSTEKGFSVNGAIETLSEKAGESIRYAAIQKESYDARHDSDAFLDELKGNRVWRVGGVGMWAYEKDDKIEERKKEVWRQWGEKHGKDEWLMAARTRTDMYRKDSNGIRPLLKWKLVERGGNLPDDAIPIGHEANGSFLYACRAWLEGGLHLGKAGSHLVNKASISYGGSEHTLDIYEVLCGPSDPNLLQWRIYGHGESANVDGWQPVEGGREKDGKPLFIAKGEYENGVHPGKCLINDDHACIGFGGGELWIRPFQVLAYCSPNRR